MYHRSNSRNFWHLKVHDVDFVDNALESHPSSSCLVPPYASKRVAPLSFLGPSGLVFLGNGSKTISFVGNKYSKVIIDKC